jgi:hypothetical protein
MRSGQVWPRASQVQGHKKQLVLKEQSALGEDETEKAGDNNGRKPPTGSAAETAVQHRTETDELPRHPASLRSAEEKAEFERSWIGPAAPRSIKETALLEFLEAPSVLIIQADERESRIDESDNASVLAWPSGMVISILTLGWLAFHHWRQMGIEPPRSHGTPTPLRTHGKNR